MPTSDAHVVVMKGIRQAVGHHGVLQGGVAHLHAGPHVQGVRSLRAHNERPVCPRLSLAQSKMNKYQVPTLLMFSMPPATTTVDSPDMMD